VIFIKTRKPLEPDSDIMIILKTDEDSGLLLELHGRVVRKIKRRPSNTCSMFVSSKNGMGVRLTIIPQEYKDLISDLHQKCFSYSNHKTLQNEKAFLL